MKIVIETDDRDVFEHLLYMLRFYKRIQVKTEENEEKVTCDDCEYAEESLVYDSLWCKKFRYEVSGGTPACSEFKRKKEGF